MDDRRRRFETQALPHMDAAYNLARWLSRSPVDADDIVQDAMLRAFRAFDGFRGGDIKAWLLTIVRNCWRSAGSGQPAARPCQPGGPGSGRRRIPTRKTTAIQAGTQRRLDAMIAAACRRNSARC